MPHRPTVAPSRSTAAPLYRKLRPRPNGPAREEVASNQRGRLHGAMVEAITARGYEQTSVAELCRLAGISKRTFYEQFENKEACYLASYERLSHRAIARLQETLEGLPSDGDVTPALTALLADVVARPKETRLVMSSMPRGPALLRRRERRRNELRQAVIAALTHESSGVRFPLVLVNGIGFGVERALSRALLMDHAHTPGLPEGLARWLSSLCSPAYARLEHALDRPLREDRQLSPSLRGRNRTASRRARVLRATAEITATEGYGRLTISKIAARAQLPEESLVPVHEGTEAYLLEALDLVNLEAIMAAVEAGESARNGVAGACLGIRTLLELVARDHVLRRLIFAEASHAGPTATHRAERIAYGLLEALRARLPHDVSEPTWAGVEATAGALWGVIQDHVTRGNSQTLPALSSQISFLVLAPMVGGEAACDALGEVLSATSAY